MKNRKSQCNRAVCILAATMLSLASLGAQDTLTKPENYDEIAALVKTTVPGHALYTKEERDARDRAFELLRAKGEEALPALLFHFSESTSNHYRLNLIPHIRDCAVSKETKKTVADFFLKRMNLETKDYSEALWVMLAMENFIAKGDPEQARRIAWTFLDTLKPYSPEESRDADLLDSEEQRVTEGNNIQMREIMRAGAMSVLREVGTREDLERLGLTSERAQSIINAREVGTVEDLERLGFTAERAQSIINAREPTTPQASPTAQEPETSVTVTTTESSSLVWLITLAVAFLAGIGYVFYRRK